MREPVEASGDTVEEAIDAGLGMLGATEDEVEIQILSEGSGLPGHGDRARVRVKLRDERGPADIAADRDEELQAATPDELDAQLDAAADFLDGLLDVLDMDADLETSSGPDGGTVELLGEEMGLLIGRHGATLQALQDLTRAAVKNRTGTWPAVTVDVEGYLARRRESLTQRARSLAERVRSSKRPSPMPAMPPGERKIVHEALSKVTDVRTASEGEGEDRHVVIYPA